VITVAVAASRLAVLLAAIAAVWAAGASGQERLASRKGDVQAHFADCFRPPHVDGLITLYFSLTRAGQVYGRPRVVLIDFSGSPESRSRLSAESLKAFNKCLPIPLNEELARAIPGKVYFLQFNDKASGKVILKPYGSHGGSVFVPDVTRGLGPELRRGGIRPRSW
jgi:hypothetical protein